MNYKELITKSKNCLEENPAIERSGFSAKFFSSGATWMANCLNELESSTANTKRVNFNAYGILKYGICLAAFLSSAYFFLYINKFLLPLSILVFYFFEIHFLFLFPLLIDGTVKPLQTSVRQTYKIGIFRALITVIPIGFFMVAGLLNITDPFRNWHIGCLSILIWYKIEIRKNIIFAQN